MRWSPDIRTRSESNSLGNILFVNLEDMDHHTADSGEFLVADVAFKVLGLLMLY